MHIPLDHGLQFWVMLPITLATILMALLRRNLTAFMLREPLTNLSKVMDGNNLARSARLRQNARFISHAQFEARRQTFIADKGPFDKPVLQMSSISAMMNPDNLANQVSTIAMSVLPQMILGEWASQVFAGVVVCRLPFTLPPRFRTMLQSGVETAGQNLPVSYVSSLSWYILSLFGCGGLVSLLVDAKDDEFFMPSVKSPLSMNLNPNQVFSKEREALSSFTHKYSLHKEEEKFLATNPSQFALY